MGNLGLATPTRRRTSVVVRGRSGRRICRVRRFGGVAASEVDSCGDCGDGGSCWCGSAGMDSDVRGVDGLLTLVQNGSRMLFMGMGSGTGEHLQRSADLSSVRDGVAVIPGDHAH